MKLLLPTNTSAGQFNMATVFINICKAYFFAIARHYCAVFSGPFTKPLTPVPA